MRQPGRADTRSVVSVWLIGWLGWVGWLVDTPKGLKVIGSSAPSAAHLAQGMSQLLHLLRLQLKRWSSSSSRRCSQGAESQEVLHFVQGASQPQDGQAAIWCNSRIEALGQASINPSSRQSQASAYRKGGDTEGREYLLCNDYFSTMRAATDKRSSPVERVDQVDKD